MKCHLLAAVAKTQSSSSWTQRKSGWLQNCWVLSCRQCSADLQVYAFAALGIHPALCQSLRDTFHQAQNFRGSVIIVLFLVLIGESCPSAIPGLQTDLLSPTQVTRRRAKCSSDADGQGNCLQHAGGTGKQGDGEWQKWHKTSKLELRKWWSNAGRQQKPSSAAPSVCTREPEVQLHGNPLRFPMGRGLGSKASNTQEHFSVSKLHQDVD